MKRFGREGSTEDVTEDENELHRINFYSDRYFQHLNSIKFGEKQLKKI